MIFTIINKCESFVKKEEPLVWDQKNELDITHALLLTGEEVWLLPSAFVCRVPLPSIWQGGTANLTWQRSGHPLGYISQVCSHCALNVY